ncbi:MAG TPA: DNA internalization-related competence protein ComEC/Rec2 [Ramlibacter sp.]|jgi:competence protein ComEC|uniref:DNA internalization-related competence protein ComEC/Rec2 n=1 Tax=Ramlibacter sp. TaxID=1917967 RepID=UPI002D4E3B0C|nr:DNA internalization-related competence protein ComEC/Rec2 [Ramlibacter sp.]HZY20667.1 DNA internalization-related competence protein ComEC/Rec2 [Ramlibacter sp.]
MDLPPAGRLWVPLLAGAVLGPAVQMRQPALWPFVAYGALAAATAVALAVVFWRTSRAHLPARTASLLLAAACGFGLAGARAAHFLSQGLDPALEGRDLAVVGTVAAMPQRNELGQRFRFEVEAARDGAAAVRLPPLVSLGWYGGPAAAAGAFELQGGGPDLHPGERWAFSVRLRAPHGTLNPHGFDQELWLWEQDLQATGYVRAGRGDPAPALLSTTGAHPVERARQSVRASIEARVADRQAGGVLAALVVGDQNAIDRTDWDVFRATGVAHLLSISGLHVTMFAWLAAALIGAGWRRVPRLCLAWPAPHAALLGGLLLAAGYALFSGWGVPAQRTLLMLASLGWLRLSGRRWPWPVSWLFACAIVVTADPWALMQPGFWLSFVAVGVLFATDPGHAPGPPRWRDRALGLLREQAVVTLALAPLTLLLFGQVSLVGLAANLVAIPWVTLVVTPLAMAGVLVRPAWDLAAVTVQALQVLLQWLAAWPFAVWHGAAPPLWAGAAGVVGGLLLAMRLPPPMRMLGVPLVLPVLLWQAPRPPPGEFELLAVDVGQGNAVLVRTASHTLVYDTGPRWGNDSDAGQRVLVPLLRALGERVDTVVLSHRDSDHTGGAMPVLLMQPQARLAGSLEDGHVLQTVRPQARCLQGQEWHWDGVAFRFLHPAPADFGTAQRPNALSCVLRVSNPRQAALLAGDVERPQEDRLLVRGEPLQAQVLLVPHHGSRTSSSAGFLDAVQPRWALVQAGYRNRFGHPAAPVLERYAARGATVVDSAWCGAAWWSSAQPEAMRCERDAARRYWHHQKP